MAELEGFELIRRYLQQRRIQLSRKTILRKPSAKFDTPEILKKPKSSLKKIKETDEIDGDFWKKNDPTSPKPRPRPNFLALNNHSPSVDLASFNTFAGFNDNDSILISEPRLSFQLESGKSTEF